MSYQTLEFSEQGAIGIVRLNRPDRLNAISREMLGELDQVVKAVRDNEAIRVLIFTGNGRAFSAGADITGLIDLRAPRDVLGFLEEIQTVFNTLEDLNLPTIAALNGIAFGGACELALACDLRIIADDAAIGVPEVKIGLLPGAGGTQRLTRLLPPAVAKQMLYLGDPLSAADCLRHGLVNEVVPRDKVFETALAWAEKLAKLAPLAIRSAKLLIHGAAYSGLKEGIEAERQAVAFLFGTEDRDEGINSFLEKRKASFSGR